MLDYILPFFFLVFFAIVIWEIPFFKLDGVNRIQLLLIFFLKVAFALLLWWVYTYYYDQHPQADLFKYFEDAKTIFQACNADLKCIFQILSGINWEQEHVQEVLKQSQHWYRQNNYGLFNDNRSIIKIHLLILYFSNGIFHVHNLFFAFFSMLGSVALFHFAKNYFRNGKLLFIAIFLIPSVLFWSSAALKESWLICTLGLFLWQFQKLLNKISLSNVILLLGIGFLLIFIKTYVFFCLIPALLFLILSKHNPKKQFKLFVFLHLVLFAGLLLCNYLMNWQIFETLQAKQDSLNQVMQNTEVGSSFEIAEVDNLWKAIISAPQALGNTFFEPWIHQSKNILQLLSAVENLVFLLLMLLAIVFFKAPEGKALSIFLFSISFVLLLGLLIGWTTPISGAIVRYKVPLLPFLAIILIQAINFNKLKNLFQPK